MMLIVPIGRTQEKQSNDIPPNAHLRCYSRLLLHYTIHVSLHRDTITIPSATRCGRKLPWRMTDMMPLLPETLGFIYMNQQPPFL